MAMLKVSSFNSWDLSDEETIQGSILTYAQKQVIQNQITEVAEQILNLTYNPQNPQDFVQNDAHLKGQLSILRYLILRSDETEELVLRMANPT